MLVFDNQESYEYSANNHYFEIEDIKKFFDALKDLGIIPSRYHKGIYINETLSEDGATNPDIFNELISSLYNFNSPRIQECSLDLLEQSGSAIDEINQIAGIFDELINKEHSTSFNKLVPSKEVLDMEFNRRIMNQNSGNLVHNVYNHSNDIFNDGLTFRNIRTIIPAMDTNKIGFLTADCIFKSKYDTNQDTNSDGNILRFANQHDGKEFAKSFSQDELQNIYRISNHDNDFDDFDSEDFDMETLDFDMDDSIDMFDGPLNKNVTSYLVMKGGLSTNEYMDLLKRVDSFLRTKVDSVAIFNDDDPYPEYLSVNHLSRNQNMFAGFATPV